MFKGYPKWLLFAAALSVIHVLSCGLSYDPPYPDGTTQFQIEVSRFWSMIWVGLAFPLMLPSDFLLESTGLLPALAGIGFFLLFWADLLVLTAYFLIGKALYNGAVKLVRRSKVLIANSKQ